VLFLGTLTTVELRTKGQGVPDTVQDWLNHNAERQMDRTASESENIKLLVTFALAVSVTMVATGLQVGSVTALDVLGLCLLAAGFLATILVVILDNRQEPNPKHAQERAKGEGWSESQQLCYITALTNEARQYNEKNAERMRQVAKVQLCLALGSALTAGLSLLQG
jgi:hypothetical protein